MSELKRLPSVDRILQSESGQLSIAQYGRSAAAGAARTVLAQARLRLEHAHDGPRPDERALAAQARDHLDRRGQSSIRRVFNLTGTVLHTNLGRAVLPEEAIAAAITAMRHPVTLEYDLNDGRRAERDDHVRDLIRELTGAEDVCLVNNNAAAILLVLSTLASRRECIVSRGELIEIGGSFRLPDIMRRAGAKLVEVGTTNRTHLRDFEDAIGPRTGLIMKAHQSNFEIRGFTAEVSAADLGAVARRRGIPFCDDLGSGTLVDLTRFGLRRERMVQDALKDGADLVTFSGDKLLGGPQCGFILGRSEFVRACARNHLKRSLRLDKIRLAALEATLKLYRDPDRIAASLPALRSFLRPLAEIEAQARQLLPLWRAALPVGWTADVAPCASQIGSGALPVDTLPSITLCAAPANRRSGRSLDALARRLRGLPIPVIGRIHDGALRLDLRCLDDEPAFAAQLAHLTELPAMLVERGASAS